MWAFILMFGCVLRFGIACDAADGRSRKALWDQVAQAEADLARVGWPGMQVRRDIGLRALRHAAARKGVQDGW